MTVAYHGPRWLEPIVRHLDLAWFDRAVDLRLAGLEIDDHFIMRLRHLDHLRSLSLINTSVTADAVIELQQQLPECDISRHDIYATLNDMPSVSRAAFNAATIELAPRIPSIR